MASNSGISHYPKMEMPPFYNHHLAPFPEPLISSSSLLSVGLAATSGINGTPGVIFPRSPNAGLRGCTVGMLPAESCSSMSNLTVNVPAGNSLSNVPVQDPMSTLAVEWTPYEQAILEEGIRRFTHVPGMMKYVKIAAFINDKTVRDVALRCQWMCKTGNIGKWQRQDENSNWKKATDRKDKVLQLQPIFASSQNRSMHSYPSGITERDHKHGILSEDETIYHLLDQNYQIFSQVAHNQENYKLQDNVDLLRRARNNIATITNRQSTTCMSKLETNSDRMNEMSGVMGVMPSIPVAIQEDLANAVLLGTTKNQVIQGRPVTNQPMQEFYYG